MSGCFRKLISRRIFYLFVWIVVLGVQRADCQDSGQRIPNQFYSPFLRVQKYLAKMKEEEVKEEERKYKDIIDLSRLEISKAKNVSKKNIIYDCTYKDNNGWVLYFYEWRREPMFLVKVHVSSDKKTVEITPPGLLRFK